MFPKIPTNSQKSTLLWVLVSLTLYRCLLARCRCIAGQDSCEPITTLVQKLADRLLCLSLLVLVALFSWWSYDHPIADGAWRGLGECDWPMQPGFSPIHAESLVFVRRAEWLLPASWVWLCLPARSLLWLRQLWSNCVVPDGFPIRVLRRRIDFSRYQCPFNSTHLY